MNYTFRFQPHGDVALRRHLNAAAERLAAKLARVDVSSLGISDYNQRYLTRSHLPDLGGGFQRDNYILSLLIQPGDRIQDKVFVDYGGGSGLLSMLAKEVGIGTVVHNDIYDVSAKDALLLGQAVDCAPDHRVVSSIEEFLSHLSTAGLTCDYLGSHDCLEHIYDVEGFLAHLGQLGHRARVVMASGANTYNASVTQSSIEKARTIELEDRGASWAHKQRYALKAYLTIRKEMISELALELGEPALERLKRNTWGLCGAGIERAVREYQTEGICPAPSFHPTNPCDPYAGNGAEPLMDISRLEELLRGAGQAVRTRPDINSNPQGRDVRGIRSGLRAALTLVQNLVISLSEAMGLRIAPFFALRATPRMLEAA